MTCSGVGRVDNPVVGNFPIDELGVGDVGATRDDNGRVSPVLHRSEDDVLLQDVSILEGGVT